MMYGLPERGCWLDCSAQSATTLNVRIVLFAREAGMELDVQDLDVVERVSSQDFSDHEDVIDALDALGEISDECVEWLNEHRTKDDCFFTVGDNSLYLDSEHDWMP